MINFEIELIKCDFVERLCTGNQSRSSIFGRVLCKSNRKGTKEKRVKGERKKREEVLAYKVYRILFFFFLDELS